MALTAAFVVCSGTLATVFSLHAPAASHPLADSGDTPALISGNSDVTDTGVPLVLSQQDQQLYSQIFSASKAADWARADALMAKVSDKLLFGHVLAARYLHRHYNSTPAELTAWLNQYDDHPEAADIYVLDVAKSSTAARHSLPLLHKQISLQGYGDDNGLSHTNDPAFQKEWHRGLAAWKNGDKKSAAHIFAGLLNDSEYRSPWTMSAAAYWAYRSYHAMGDTADAGKYLNMAASEPRCFYGILARRQLGQSLDLDNAPAALSANDALQIIGDPSIRRIVALSQAGMDDLADQEIRVLFPQAGEQEKYRLLTLAHSLNLASVQISMAAQLSHDGLDYARYPTPNWQPSSGFAVDPALIYALARQESGFRANAVSPGGALGLMQLMPKTALLMQHHGSMAGNVSEPVTNITLGQAYIENLLSDNLVNNNLIYLLAAYNAGPGRLQEWQEKIATDDPLYFMESIPYAQTRNYVTQVMTNYWIYSELSGHPQHSVYALATGKWPVYEAIPAMASRITNDKAG